MLCKKVQFSVNFHYKNLMILNMVSTSKYSIIITYHYHYRLN